MKLIAKISIATVCGITALMGPSLGSAKSTADYELAADYKFGDPNFWDYLTFDPSAKRVYIAHVNKVEVVDTTTGKLLGHVGPFHDTHGIAVVPQLNKGYADSGDDGIVKVFDLGDYHITKSIKVSVDADGMVYDPQTHMVLVVAGDSKNLTTINTADDSVAKTVVLPGKPEFLAIDAHGHAFVNISDTAAIAKVDIASGTVMATWPLEGCERPHGLAYDVKTDRLFSGCANSVLVVVDGTTGKNLAKLPIGSNSDAVVVDSRRHRAMSANGDGTLTVINEGDNDQFTVQRTVLSLFGGRNATIDEDTGTVFIAHGNMKLMSSTKNVLQLRFGWDGMNLAVLKPND